MEEAALRERKCECIIENGFCIFMLMLNCIDLTGEVKYLFNLKFIYYRAKTI